jgi:hypothetical protein
LINIAEEKGWKDVEHDETEKNAPNNTYGWWRQLIKKSNLFF